MSLQEPSNDLQYLTVRDSKVADEVHRSMFSICIAMFHADDFELVQNRRYEPIRLGDQILCRIDAAVEST